MADNEVAREVELRDYLGILRTRWPIVVAVFLLVASMATTMALLETPTYRASATVLLQPRDGETLFNSSTGQRSDPTRNVQTEIQILRSGPVKDAVREKLGAAPPAVAAAPVGQTDVITVSVTSEVPEDAAAFANSYAESYIAFRRKQAVDSLFAAGKELQAKVSELQQQAAAPNLSVSVKEALAGQIELFKSRLDQIQVDGALKTGGAQLVTRAGVPDSPVAPNPLRSAVVGGFLGLLLGVGAAFLRDYLDDSIKGRDDVTRAGVNLPVIGLIPSIADWKNQRANPVVAIAEPGSAPAEAYRSLRTAVQFLGFDRPLRTIQITSPGPGEGKTTTASNLAAVLAETGRSVLLIDMDLRRPRLHEQFSISNNVGVTSVLIGEAPLSRAAVKVGESLFVLPSGPLPPNPSELVGSARAAELIRLTAQEFDIVVIDSPPLLPVTDPLVIARSVDAVVLVAAAGVTTRKQLHRATELLTQVNAPLEGIALNRAGDHSAYSYSYANTEREAKPTNQFQKQFDRMRTRVRS